MARQSRRILTEWTFDGEVREQRDFYLPVDVLSLFIDLNMRRTYIEPNTPESAPTAPTAPISPDSPIEQEPYLPPSKVVVEEKYIEDRTITDPELPVRTVDPVDRGYIATEPSTPQIDLDIGTTGGKMESESLDYIPTKEPSAVVVEYDANVGTSPVGYTDAGTYVEPAPPKAEVLTDERTASIEETIYYDKEQALLDAEVVSEKSVSTSGGTGDVADIVAPDPVSTPKTDYTTSPTVDLDVGIAGDSPIYNDTPQLAEEHETISTTNEPLVDVVDTTPTVTQVDRTLTPQTVDETTYVKSATEYQTGDDVMQVSDGSYTTSDYADVADVAPVAQIATPPPSQPAIDTSISDVSIPAPSTPTTLPEPIPVVTTPDIKDEPTVSTSTVITASTPTTNFESETTLEQPPAISTKIVVPKDGAVLTRDFYTVVPLKFSFFVDGSPVFSREMEYYPSQVQERVQIPLPSALRAGKHIFGISVSTTRAIYKGDVKIEYDLPAVQAWSSDQPPQSPDLPTVPTPPEIPNPIKMVSDWWDGVLSSIGLKG